MPYDGREFETKPDVFSLEGLIAWLEKMPADDAYDFWDFKNCALCQYLHAHGIAADAGLGLATEPQRNYGRMAAVCGGAGQNLAIGADHRSDWTFGKMLQRARALQSAAYARGV